MATKTKTDNKYIGFTCEPEMLKWLQDHRVVKNGLIETKVPLSQIVKSCISRCMQDSD